jgi:hypothetical protein
MEPATTSAIPSPADRRIALIVTQICPAQRVQLGANSTCTNELATIDTETGTHTPLPAPLTDIRSAGWSPDGRRLSLLGSAGGGPTGLSILDLQDRSMVKLGDAEPDLTAWSSDGAWIAYWRLDPGMADGDRVQVWVAPTTGGDPRFVVAHATVAWLRP